MNWREVTRGGELRVGRGKLRQRPLQSHELLPGGAGTEVSQHGVEQFDKSTRRLGGKACHCTLLTVRYHNWIKVLVETCRKSPVDPTHKVHNKRPELSPAISAYRAPIPSFQRIGPFIPSFQRIGPLIPSFQRIGPLILHFSVSDPLSLHFSVSGPLSLHFSYPFISAYRASYPFISAYRAPYPYRDIMI